MPIKFRETSHCCFSGCDPCEYCGGCLNDSFSHKVIHNLVREEELREKEENASKTSDRNVGGVPS
jgi:hypothetical protein